MRLKTYGVAYWQEEQQQKPGIAPKLVQACRSTSKLTWKKVSLSKLRLWQRGSMTEYKLIYANGNIQNFEIWGSNDPAADGSFSGWTKLRSCEVVKPSNTPVGEYTDADVEEAANGHLFEFPSSTPAYRYVRVKVLNTWAGTDYMFASEFRFWEWKSKLSE